MSNNEVKQMIAYAETRPLYRKHNLLSIRISEFREIFPNANIPRIIRIMPSILTDSVHSNLVNHRFSLDRLFIDNHTSTQTPKNTSQNTVLDVSSTVRGRNSPASATTASSKIDLDELITNYPFLLTKDITFIERNIHNLCTVLKLNKTELSLLIANTPDIIARDANRAIAVKYQILSDYFLSFASENSENSENSSETFHKTQKTPNIPAHSDTTATQMTPHTLAELRNKLKWTIIRNSKILTTNWTRYARIDFLLYCKTNLNHYNRLLNISRVFDLSVERLWLKFPQYELYIIQRLVNDGNCDADKLKELSKKDLEYALGELICLEYAPKSMELDELRAMGGEMAEAADHAQGAEGGAEGGDEGADDTGNATGEGGEAGKGEAQDSSELRDGVGDGATGDVSEGGGKRQSLSRDERRAARRARK